MPTAPELRAALNSFALSLPGAMEDFPWGERTAKVNGKVFVFFGADEGSTGLGVKLKELEANERALALPGATPSGYGLGRAGWVNVILADDVAPLEQLESWVEASYRAIAPKRLVAELDRRGS